MTQRYFIFYNESVIFSFRVKCAPRIKITIFRQYQFLTDWIMTLDIRGADNSRALTRVSSRTNYYPVRLYRMNKTELQSIMDTPTRTMRISTRRNATLKFHANISVAILSFVFKSNQFISFYANSPFFSSLFLFQAHSTSHETFILSFYWIIFIYTSAIHSFILHINGIKVNMKSRIGLLYYPILSCC